MLVWPKGESVSIDMISLHTIGRKIDSRNSRLKTNGDATSNIHLFDSVSQWSLRLSMAG